MAQRGAKRYVPYEGAEPYVCLCYSEADGDSVEPITQRLWERGVRVWCATGRARGAAEAEARQLRAQGAALTLLYLTAAARDDTAIKGTVLYCLSKGQPLICIEAEEGVSALSVGMPEDTPRIAAYEEGSVAELEDVLIRTEGFTQELIGERPVLEQGSTGRRLPVIFAGLSVAMLLAGFMLGNVLGWFGGGRLRAGDTVPLADSSLIAGARAALDGGDITEESVTGIRVLHLRELPQDTAELAWFTGLERIEIPQADAERALELLDESYEIVLYGGGA